MLDEIERLRAVFSLYDPASELSQLNRSYGSFLASPDLLAVLREYENWQRVTNGACNPRVGVLVNLWKAAERAGDEPRSAHLERAGRSH